MKRPNANTVTALAASVTALAALAVAVWDNVQSRAYNRLSVRPLLVLDIVRNTTDALDLGEYRISNQGVGPAIVRDIAIRYTPPGEASDAHDFEGWMELATELRQHGFTVTGWTDVPAGRALGVDRALSLFSFQVDIPETDSARVDVQHVIDALEVEVTYGSVYGETFSTEDDG